MDPILSQLSKSAVEKTVTSSSGSSSPANGNSPFQQVLDAQTSSEDMTSKLMGLVDNTFGATGNNFNAVDASTVHVEVSKVSEVQKTPGTNQLMDMLQEVNKDQLQFENLKELISSGKTFKPQELTAMQIGVQHLSLELELFSKGLEQINRTIQTPINMQIG